MLNDILFDKTFITKSNELLSGTVQSYSMDGIYYDYTLGEPTQTQFTITLLNIIPQTEVRIYRTDNRSEIAGIESSLSSFSYEYIYNQDINCYIVFINQNYHYLKLNNVILTNKDLTIPITQSLRLF